MDKDIGWNDLDPRNEYILEFGTPSHDGGLNDIGQKLIDTVMCLCTALEDPYFAGGLWLDLA